MQTYKKLRSARWAIGGSLVIATSISSINAVVLGNEFVPCKPPWPLPEPGIFSEILVELDSPYYITVGGGNGYPEGLYITSGFFGGELIRFYSPDTGLITFASGLAGTKAMRFGDGSPEWGNYLYVSEADGLTISRVHPDGSHEVVVSGFAGPFGPGEMDFPNSPDFPPGMYVTNYSNNLVWHVESPGAEPIPFASVGQDNTEAPGIGVAGIKAGRFAPAHVASPFANNLVTTVYDSALAMGTDEPALQVVQPDGSVIEILPPMVGFEFIAFGSGDDSPFGSSIYISNLGQFSEVGDGGVLRYDPVTGDLDLMCMELDAVGIAFDTEELFGGGLLIADFHGNAIWRVVPIPAPACPADLSGPDGVPDGTVDVFDLIELINQWGPCGDPNNCPADLSGPAGEPEGTVDVFDLIELINNWGECPS